jgi:hypothetical protein
MKNELKIRVVTGFNGDTRKEFIEDVAVNLETAKIILEKLFNGTATYQETKDMLDTWGIYYENAD